MTPEVPGMRVARTKGELEEALEAIRREAGSLALVPTMGSFHPGHLSLIERAGELASATSVSIFVNPLQFGPGEDLNRYPRDVDRDLALAAAHGVGLAFVPAEEVMYPGGTPQVTIDPGPMEDRMCGPFRPGHFRGVLTVVSKLFGLLRPDVAVVGRKDLQQAALIRRMVSDLELGVAIDVAPLVREADGLAMSSRNLFLGAGDRQQAVGLFRALSAADEAFREGERQGEALVRRVRDVLSGYPGLSIQYVEVVEPHGLGSIEEVEAGTAIAVAGLCGGTRLIDNLVLGADQPDPRGAPDVSGNLLS